MAPAYEQRAADRQGVCGISCELADMPDKMQTSPRWMLKLMEIFMPVLHKNDEMMLLFENDYRFDSSKIESAYRLKATPYRQGIAVSLKLGM